MRATKKYGIQDRQNGSDKKQEAEIDKKSICRARDKTGSDKKAGSEESETEDFKY